MTYCVLLDSIENDAKVKAIDESESILKTAYRLMHCSTVQLIPLYPDRLPQGYEALTDENTYGKSLFFNPLASWLYGCDDHGQEIFNNCVIFKVKGDDFTGMTHEEAQRIADDLNSHADEIYDLTMFKALCPQE